MRISTWFLLKSNPFDSINTTFLVIALWFAASECLIQWTDVSFIKCLVILGLMLMLVFYVICLVKWTPEVVGKGRTCHMRRVWVCNLISGWRLVPSGYCPYKVPPAQACYCLWLSTGEPLFQMHPPWWLPCYLLPEVHRTTPIFYMCLTWIPFVSYLPEIPQDCWCKDVSLSCICFLIHFLLSTGTWRKKGREPHMLPFSFNRGDNL